MNRKLTIYIVFLAVIIGFIIFIDASRPKPINWTPTYSSKDKIPFGLYILNQEAENFFKGQEIEKFSVTPYEYFDNLYDYENKAYTTNGTVLNIQENDDVDTESVNELLYFADHGNTVFLSMKFFPQNLLDTLNVTINESYTLTDPIAVYTEKLGEKEFLLDEGAGFTYFDSIDTLRTSVLGHQIVKNERLSNFIRVRHGMGSVILHTQPAAFTNFHLLKGDHYLYAESVLSFLPDNGTLYWYSKYYNTGESSSPLRYALNQPGLKWVIYFGLICFLIFAIFNAKRKQRIVPEIPPVKNTTVDFTKTIGNLYYQEGNHHTIVDKKIIYFLEHIRKEYLIDTYSLDDNFVEKLHLKTGKPVEDIQKTVSLIKKHRHQFQSSETDVIEINKAIENLRL